MFAVTVIVAWYLVWWLAPRWSRPLAYGALRAFRRAARSV